MNAGGGGGGATATSSVVTANPASPTTAGTSVTFTATMTPSSAAGTVQFKDGGNNLGTAVTVSGGVGDLCCNDSASQGSHTITAAFAPTDATAFVASTSPGI